MIGHDYTVINWREMGISAACPALDALEVTAYIRPPVISTERGPRLSEQELKTRLTAVMPRLGGLGAIIAFDFGEDGKYVVDARGATAKMAGPDAEPACTIKATGATMLKLIDGSLDPMLAYTLGKLKISGSMGVAMKLASSLGS